MFHDIRRVLTSNIWVGLVGIASSIVFPRVLTIADYAYYQTFALYLSYIGFFHFGIADGIFIEHGGSTRDRVDRSQLKSEVGLLVLVLMLSAIAGLAASVLTGDMMYGYLGLSILAANIYSSYRLLLQAWGEFRRYAWLNLGLPSLILVGGVVLFLLQGRLTGQELILVNVWGYAVFSIVIMVGVASFTRGFRATPMLSSRNMRLWRTGLAAMLGGIATIAFLSVGRQIVLLAYSKSAFAMYSFAMSLQAIMTVFIGAIAQPLYWRLASKDVDAGELQRIKEGLLTFGAMSGLAYFACHVFVSWYVPKYLDSMRVVLAYFTVFPAMSVVNGLYVSLYKTTRQMRKYVHTVVIILIVAVGLTLLTLPTGRYELVALAVSAAYYVWLFYSVRHFAGLAITMKDVGFICAYLLAYIAFSGVGNAGLGAAGYTIVMASVASVFYRGSLRALMSAALKAMRSRS